MTEPLLNDPDSLRRLARAVAGRSDELDDAVQDAWLTLTHRPRYASHPRAFQRRAIRNAILGRRRADVARRARERLLRDDEVAPSAADEACRRQRSRVLADMVAGLPEPYRSTVIDRFVRHLSIPEIAAQESVAEPTVRSRQRRALRLLRERLESRYGQDAEAALGLAALKVPSSIATSSGWKLSGWIAMTTLKKGAIAVFVAVAAIVGWSTRRDVDSPEPSVKAPHTPAPAEVPSAQLDPTKSEAPITTEEPIPAPSRRPDDAASASTVTDEPIPIGTMRVATRDGRDRPLPGALVYIQPKRRGDPPRLPPDPDVPRDDLTTRRTDASGRVVLTGLAPGSYQVGALAIGKTLQQHRVTLGDPSGSDVVFRFADGAIQGHVYDIDGRVIDGVLIRVEAQDNSFGVYAHTDPTGRYRIEGLRSLRYWVSTEYDPGSGAHNYFRAARVEEAQTVTVDFGEPRAWPRFRGELRDLSGAAVENPPGLLIEGHLHFQREGDSGYFSYPLDAEGRFDIPLERARYTISVNAPAWRERQVLLEGYSIEGDSYHTLTLPGASLVLREPPPNDARRPRRSVRLKGHDYPAAFRSVPVNEHGVTRFFGLEPGTYLLSMGSDQAPREIEIDRAPIVEVSIP